jgi:KDO2-lipid IV(A) lauroyltransferase
MKNNNSPYAIRHWPIWIGAGLIWLLIQLPYKYQLILGKYIGLLALKFAHRERKIAEINLSRCFPELSLEKRKILLRESFIAMGIGAFETAFGWWGSEKRLNKLVIVEGLEHIENALKNNQGALIFTPHFSSLHISGRLLSLFHPFSVMYFPPKNIVFREISRRAMHRFYKLAIPRDDARTLIKSLKKNMAILYTPDTDAGLKNSIFAPFFGISTASVTATSRFAHISHCAVIPATYFRNLDGSGYKVKFYAALENYPTDNPYNDAVLINQWIEKFIKEHPEQYLWQYKRFKTRPSGEEQFYNFKKTTM